MNSISVNQFRDNLKTYVEQTVSEHELEIAPVVKVVSLNVPLHPEMDETEYPVLAVTVKVAVWP